MWTGDNQAVWSHLQASIPMILSMNIAGFPFAGADVGGFFGNPSKELLTRWYQAGAFYPFFRGHAHIDTRRREPYLAGEPYTGIITQALRLRYQLLPAWYTAFHTASVSGQPIIRPMYYIHPTDSAGFAIEDQLYLADTGLLVKPVTTEGATSVDIYLPPSETYFDYSTYQRYSGAGKTVHLEAPLEKLPVLMRAGYIIPRKDRLRRSSGLMKYDPYTLVIVLTDAGTATGELYVDDGESFDYKSGAFVHRNFTMERGVLESKDLKTKEVSGGKLVNRYLNDVKDIRVEKIIVVNAPKSWNGKKEVAVIRDGVKRGTAGIKTEAGKNGGADWAVVRDPGVGVGTDWRIEF